MDGAEKRYKVIVTDRAAQMLISHAQFLARASEAAAGKLIAEFEEKAESLESLPERNPWISDPLLPERKYRKLLLAGRYLMIYQIKDNTVYVDAVVDCRQNYTWLL